MQNGDPTCRNAIVTDRWADSCERLLPRVRAGTQSSGQPGVFTMDAAA